MSESLVSINIVVKDGEQFIRHCLAAVRAQTYSHIEVTILDNASGDRTRDIIRNEFPEFHLIEHPTNVGMWPGQELLLSQTIGVYVLALSVDVIIDQDFITRAVASCEDHRDIAAVQAKIYQYDIGTLTTDHSSLTTHIIDTCGFTLTRGRKIVNIGHGEADGPAYRTQKTIFGVEGAAPFFRRTALEACRIQGHIVDPDYFWYGDDLDLAWRMTLLGHRQTFIPDVVAWHDRSTTKGQAHTMGEHLSRIGIRGAIPLAKRRLDWSNVRFTIIKNDYIINLLRDMPYILVREVAVLGYTLLFEPGMLREIPRFLRLLPTMFRRRRLVMTRAMASPSDIRRFFL